MPVAAGRQFVGIGTSLQLLEAVVAAATEMTITAAAAAATTACKVAATPPLEHRTKWGHCCGTSDSFDGQHTGKFNNCHGAGSGGGGWFGGGAGNCDQPGAGGSGTTRGLFENKHTSSAGSSGSSNYGGLGGQAMFEGTQYNNDGQTGRGGDPGHGGSNGKVTIFWNNVVTTTTTTPTVVVTTTKLTTTTTTTFTTVKDETYCTAGEFLYQQFFAGFTIDPYCTACRTGKFIQEKSHQLDKCKSFSTCGSDSYKVTAGTKTSDTECKKLVVCTQGSQYETLAPKTGYGSSEYTSDRECEDVTPCRGDEYVQMTATKDKDQQCTKCDGTAAAIRGGCEQTTKRTTTRRTTRKPDTTQWQPDDDDDYYERRTTRRRTTVPAVIVTATTTTATITTATTTTTIPVSTLSADDYTAAGVELLDAIDMIERELSIATGSPMVEHLLDIGYSSTDIYALQFFDDDELLDGGFNSITLLQAERAYAEATEKGNGGTVAAVIIVVILLVGGFAYFVYRRKQSMEEESGGVVEWKEAAYITSCMTWLSELCEGCGGGGGSSSEMSGFTERDVQKHRSSTRSRSGSINTGGKATALTDKCGWKSAASGQTCAVQTSNIHCPRHTCTKPKCMNGKESSQPFCSEHMAEETIVVNPLAGNDDADEEYGTMAHVAIDAPEIDEDEYGPSVGIANDVNVENFGGFEGGDGDDDSLYEVQNDEEI